MLCKLKSESDLTRYHATNQTYLLLPSQSDKPPDDIFWLIMNNAENRDRGCQQGSWIVRDRKKGQQSKS